MTLRRILGVVALVLSASFFCWYVYCRLYPTPAYWRGYTSVFQLLASLAFFLLGWHFLLSKGADSQP
jgi:hypothetical protein